MSESERVRVVVVTGLSGAGKSTALRALEDLGYFCVDNLPPALLDRTVEVCEAGDIRRIGLGVDVRVGSFLDGAVEALQRIGAPDQAGGPARDVVVLFLDASDEAIVRRFSETRRPHPLTGAARARMVEPASGAALGSSAQVGAVAVLDGVQLERERLSRLRASATMVLDTTLLSVHELRAQVIAHLGPGKNEQPRMMTRFLSFGFKYGIPVDADVVLDVRLLDNPYFVPELRNLTGNDAPVRDYILNNPDAVELIRRSDHLLSFALPRYEREGKSYLTVAIGCTGGRHRSVTVATALAEGLREKTGLPILVLHRDVGRSDNFGTRPSPPSGGGRWEGGAK
jgi:RNase adapter protein RapZ